MERIEEREQDQLCAAHKRRRLAAQMTPTTVEMATHRLYYEKASSSSSSQSLSGKQQQQQQDIVSGREETQCWINIHLEQTESQLTFAVPYVSWPTYHLLPLKRCIL